MSNSALLAFLLVAGALTPGAALGQSAMELAIAGPQPHFVAAWAPKKEREAERSAVLAGRVSLELRDVSLDAALKALTNQAGLRITYSRAMLPAGKRVTISASDVAVVTAMTEMLFRSGLDVVVDRDGALALVTCRHWAEKPEAEVQDSGVIVGTVTDETTGAAVVGATVIVEQTGRITTTDNEGRFRIAGLKSGAYTLRLRYIGYAPLAITIAVRANAEVEVQLALQRSAQRLEEVVTTGTLVPTQVKALPTPVAIITDSQIALQRPSTVMELFRQSIPTAVSFNPASNPEASVLNVRGASTLLYGVGGMKLFVDGIEVAFDIVAGIHPSNIERIEVIRGPQAAAIYGSDAVGGVVSIFTKRGDPNLSRPQVLGEAALSVAETPYPGFGEVPLHSYKGSLRGGGPDVSYNIAADYSHLADWLPGGAKSARSRYGMSGGMRYTSGIVTLDLSARHNLQHVPQVSNPDLANTGLPATSRPSFQTARFTNQTIGAQLILIPIRGWSQTLRLGVDRFNNDLDQDRPRLTTPDDTLLTTLNFDRAKTSIGYGSTLEGRLTAAIAGSVTVGFDHYALSDRRFFSFNSLTTTGEVRPAPGASILAFRINSRNTGYFAQAQLGFHDALFLTAGLRAEQNTEFGDSIATPVSPRIGASYVRHVGGTSLKVRSSWGRAIRAPVASAKDERVFPDFLQLANLNLRPERQQGWDAGFDLAFDQGVVSVTYYDQTADDLIQNVQLDVTPIATFQNQNVGRVKNTGVEVEGSLAIGAIQLRAQYGYTRSRIEALSLNYTGDLRVGDQAFGTPEHTAGASFSAALASSTTITGGLAYVGSWNDYDYVAQFSCFGGTGPCYDFNFRSFIITYPGFVKLNAGVVQEIRHSISAFLAVDNLTNSDAFEQSNAYPVMGRVTTAGLRFQL